MFSINRIPIDKCYWEGCHETAEYEFTDAVLADKHLPLNERKIKTVTIYKACFNHVEEYNNKLKKEVS